MAGFSNHLKRIATAQLLTHGYLTPGTVRRMMQIRRRGGKPDLPLPNRTERHRGAHVPQLARLC